MACSRVSALVVFPGRQRANQWLDKLSEIFPSTYFEVFYKIQENKFIYS